MLIAGDTLGVKMILKVFEKKHIEGIIAASIRPQYIFELKEISKKTKHTFYFTTKS